MTDLFFVDANPLVYVADRAVPSKQERAESWITSLWQSGNGRISIQVLNEYYVTVTRRLDPSMPAQQARSHIEDLMAWSPAPVDSDMVRLAWAIQDRYGFSWWDCLIVAAARMQDCRYLLTENMQHGQQLDGLTVVSPFEARPGEFTGLTARPTRR